LKQMDVYGSMFIQEEVRFMIIYSKFLIKKSIIFGVSSFLSSCDGGILVVNFYALFLYRPKLQLEK
jgi:hypothetical protein